MKVDLTKGVGRIESIKNKIKLATEVSKKLLEVRKINIENSKLSFLGKITQYLAMIATSQLEISTVAKKEHALNIKKFGLEYKKTMLDLENNLTSQRLEILSLKAEKLKLKTDLLKPKNSTDSNNNYMLIKFLSGKLTDKDVKEIGLINTTADEVNKFSEAFLLKDVDGKIDKGLASLLGGLINRLYMHNK